MLGSIIGAVSSIAGGLLGNSAAKKAQKAQNAREDTTLVRRVADGKAAGVSKMAAIGAPTMSMPAVNTGGNFDFLGNAGQNIARAVTTNQSPNGQIDALGKAAATVQIEGLNLDNQIKRAQLASIIRTSTQPGNAPGAADAAYAIPGQSATFEGPNFKIESKRDVSDRRTPYSVPGTGPDVVLTDTNSGGITWDTPPQLAESRESDPWYKSAIGFIRNGVLPSVHPHTRVPQEVIDRLPPGTIPIFNPLTQEWQAVRGSKRHLSIPYGYKTRR